MAEPTNRKRRAESVESEPENASMVASGSSMALVSDATSPTRTVGHKKARLDDPAPATLLHNIPIKNEDEPLFLSNADGEAGSATASTRASPVDELDQPEDTVGSATVKTEDHASAPLSADEVSGATPSIPSSSARQGKACPDQVPTNISTTRPTNAPAQTGNAASSSKSRKRARLEHEAPTISQANPAASSTQPTAAVTGTIVAAPAQHEPSLTPSRSLRDMPLELLSEILLHTQSMQAVLSVAMSCKYFCKTLLQPSSKYIWKYVRENNVPRPPPEFENEKHKWGFDEVSYAAFLFAGGKCEGCGEYCDKPYLSLSLRLRLCGKQTCEERLIKEKKLKALEKVCSDNNLRGQSSLFARLEDKALIKKHKEIEGMNANDNSAGYYLSSQTAITRGQVPDHLRSFLIEERDQHDFRERLEGIRKRQEKWMLFCEGIIKWRRRVRDDFYVKKKDNDVLGRLLAEELGFTFEDLVHCTVFGPYLRNQNHIFQSIAKGEVAALAPRIEEQLAALTEKRGRRIHEALYQETRQQILKHYTHLKSGKTFPILPALSAFRQLNVINMIQSSSGEEKTEAKNVAQSLKTDTLLVNLLKSDIKGWVEKAKTAFGAKVGVKRWKSMNKKELHPAERMSARFKCVRPGCDVVEEGYEADECFDFAGACRHECGKRGQKKKSGGNWKWAEEIFEKDEQASEAIKKYLELCKLDDRFVGTADSVAVLQAANYVVCKSCDTPIVMKFNNLIGHSHRHEKMEFELLKDPEAVEAAIGKKYGFQAGLTKILLGPGKKAQEARGAKVYGCRHCHNKQLAEHRQAVEAKKAAAASNASIEDTPVVESEEPDARMFLFDGLKSHLIEIHEIRSVRDEDWFCSKLPALLEKAKA